MTMADLIIFFRNIFLWEALFEPSESDTNLLPIISGKMLPHDEDVLIYEFTNVLDGVLYLLYSSNYNYSAGTVTFKVYKDNVLVDQSTGRISTSGGYMPIDVGMGKYTIKISQSQPSQDGYLCHFNMVGDLKCKGEPKGLIYNSIV